MPYAGFFVQLVVYDGNTKSHEIFYLLASLMRAFVGVLSLFPYNLCAHL
jgi:hypothetical protein